VIDALELGIFLQSHAVEAVIFAHVCKGRVERAQQLHGGVEADRLVTRQEGNAENVVHGRHGIREAAFLPGLGGPLVTLDGIGIGVIAADAVFRCNKIGADALGHEIGWHRHGGVDRPCAAVRRHGHAAHGFDAAANSHGRLTGHDLRRGDVHGRGRTRRTG
jgi:hypothetical protein